MTLVFEYFEQDLHKLLEHEGQLDSVLIKVTFYVHCHV